MKKFLVLTMLLFSLVMASIAHAENKALLLVGEASMKVLFWSVYDSRLYTESGSYERTQRPIKLEIEYLRNIKAEDLVSRTALEWDHLGIPQASYQTWMNKLTRIFPDIKKQDVLAMYLDKQNRTTFTFNNKLLGHIDDEAFGENFLAIWLSPDTSQPEHRLALIEAK